MEAIHQFDFTVPEAAVDANRHVNNVAYVQWMQEAAIRHSEAAGCTRLTLAAGATWVVRTHRIEYLNPAFGGELLRVQTWVAGVRKVRSLRCYRFIRVADGTVLAQGESDWVFVDALTGRPRAIPPEIREVFQAAPELK
jgi:acyl-CoA thioester hydrolase